MKHETTKQKKNAAILNALKTLDLKPKERIYAPLIIEVLEAANNFNKKLDNVAVDHNIIKQVFCQNLMSYISDEFARREEEMGKKYIKACKKLNKTFNENNPGLSEYNESAYKAITKACRRERDLMQRVILKFVMPLEFKSVGQPIFVKAWFFKDNHTKLHLTWTSGTKGGNYVLGEEIELSRKGTVKELKQIEKNLQDWVIENGNEIPEGKKVIELIESAIKLKPFKPQYA